MRQRAMIAMALVNDPTLLIADEPTTALDVTVQAQILDLMKDLQREFGSAIVLITHDLGVVAEVADDVLVMYAGRPSSTARPSEVLAAPQHPYTWGLLRACPRRPRSSDRLRADPRRAAEPPRRCRAAARSTRAATSRPVGRRRRLPPATCPRLAPGAGETARRLHPTSLHARPRRRRILIPRRSEP